MADDNSGFALQYFLFVTRTDAELPTALLITADSLVPSFVGMTIRGLRMVVAVYAMG